MIYYKRCTDSKKTKSLMKDVKFKIVLGISVFIIEKVHTSESQQVRETLSTSIYWKIINSGLTSESLRDISPEKSPDLKVYI